MPIATITETQAPRPAATSAVRPAGGSDAASSPRAPDGNGQLDRAAGVYVVRQERGLVPVAQRTGVSIATLAELNAALLGGSQFARLSPGMKLRLRPDAAAPAAPTSPETGTQTPAAAAVETKPSATEDSAAVAGSPAVGAGSAQAVSPAPTLAEVRAGATLGEGMSGEAVAHIQKLVGVKQTGTFGATTAEAVARFQKARQLSPVSGVVGPTTLAALEAGGGDIGPDAAAQMSRLLSIAESNNGGASRGDCFKYVWRYLVAAKYGKIRNHHDAADMKSDYARNFAEYMNSGSNAARWGLRRLSVTTPHDAPPGAVVVVGPGTPGTRHPTAGDIAVAAGGGRFVNDGPRMGYGPRERFLSDGGTLLGVYVPMN